MAGAEDSNPDPSPPKHGNDFFRFFAENLGIKTGNKEEEKGLSCGGRSMTPETGGSLSRLIPQLKAVVCRE